MRSDWDSRWRKSKDIPREPNLTLADLKDIRAALLVHRVWLKPNSPSLERSDALVEKVTEKIAMRERMPCRNSNSNVCAAEGCFDRSCLNSE